MITALDHQQIADTLARLAFAVDENDLDQLVDVFTSDATYDMSSSGMGVFHGLDALKTATAPLAASGHAPLAHFVTNTVITEIDDETATARSKALMIMHDGATHGVVYDDSVVRHDGRWLISGRVISPLGAIAAQH